MKPYTGRPYSPEQVRRLFSEETPESFTSHRVGRRTIQGQEGDDQGGGNPTPSSAILQPEWTGPFYRLMSDDDEMAKSSNWWFYPVRRAYAKLKPLPEWGERRTARRLLVRRCMAMYLWSNYEVNQIAAVTGMKKHEVYRALQEAAMLMSRYIGVFGHEFAAFDPTTYASGIGR